MPETATTTENTEQDTKTIKKIEDTQSWLAHVRKPYEALKQEAIDFSLPRRGTLSNPHEPKGKKKGQKVYDGAMMQILDMWADGTQGYHVSEAIRWFMQQYPDPELMENDAVRQWLQELDDYLYYVWRKSETLYAMMGDLLRDAGAAGDGYIYPEEDIDNGTIEAIVPNPKEVYVKRNKYGKIYISHRKFKLAAQDAVDQFEVGKREGNKGVSETLELSVETTPFTDLEFIHAVYENDDYREGSLNINERRYISYYFQVEGRRIVRQSGYDFMVPTDLSMVRGAGDDYGRGIVGDTIILVYALNQLAKTAIQAKQYAANPAKNIPEEQRLTARLRPGGRNYYKDAGRIITAVQSGSRFPPSDEERQYIRDILEQRFGIKFFLAMSQMEKVGQANRWEIAERQSEKAALMGPGLGPFNRVLRRLNDFILDTESQSGRLPPIPDEVQAAILEYGKPDVEFIGPLSQAQKRLFKTQGILTSLEAGQPLMEMYPETRLAIKPKKALDEIFEGTGMPQKVITGDDEYEEAVQDMRRQQQEDKELERMGQVADALPKAGKAVEDDSPLSVLAEQLMQ